MTRLKSCLAVSAALLTACTATESNEGDTAGFELPSAFPSTYEPLPSESMLLTNAVIIDGTGEATDATSLLVENGRISAIGTDLSAEGVTTFDVGGRTVTPGIIDIHSHLGNYPSPSVNAHADGNEVTSPITSEVYAEHGVWPQDPGFDEALQGGITTLHILP